MVKKRKSQQMALFATPDSDSRKSADQQIKDEIRALLVKNKENFIRTRSFKEDDNGTT